MLYLILNNIIRRYMKKILLGILLLVQQAQAIIVNYSCLLSPDGKRKIHLFSDVHVPSDFAQPQINVLFDFISHNKDAILYIDGYNPSAKILWDQMDNEVFELVRIIPAHKNYSGSREDALQILKKEFVGMKRAELIERLYRYETTQQEILSALALRLFKINREVQKDPRLDHQDISWENLKQIASDTSFDQNILKSAFTSDKDVIVLAGSLHTGKVQKILAKYGFKVAFELKKEVHLRYTPDEEAVKRSLEILDKSKNHLTKNIDVLNRCFSIAKAAHRLCMIDDGEDLPGDLLQAAIEAGDDFADMCM